MSISTGFAFLSRTRNAPREECEPFWVGPPEHVEIIWAEIVNSFPPLSVHMVVGERRVTASDVLYGKPFTLGELRRVELRIQEILNGPVNSQDEFAFAVHHAAEIAETAAASVKGKSPLELFVVYAMQIASIAIGVYVDEDFSKRNVQWISERYFHITTHLGFVAAVKDAKSRGLWAYALTRLVYKTSREIRRFFKDIASAPRLAEVSWKSHERIRLAAMRLEQFMAYAASRGTGEHPGGPGAIVELMLENYSASMSNPKPVWYGNSEMAPRVIDLIQQMDGLPARAIVDSRETVTMRPYDVRDAIYFVDRTLNSPSPLPTADQGTPEGRWEFTEQSNARLLFEATRQAAAMQARGSVAPPVVSEASNTNPAEDKAPVFGGMTRDEFARKIEVAPTTADRYLAAVGHQGAGLRRAVISWEVLGLASALMRTGRDSHVAKNAARFHATIPVQWQCTDEQIKTIVAKLQSCKSET